MNYKAICILLILLTACTSVDKTASVPSDITAENSVANEIPFQEPQAQIKQSDNVSEFALYLRQYIAKNLGDRARASRRLINRSGIEQNGRLPSKSLYQSLGYRMRDSFVALPPELSSRPFSSLDNTLHGKLIEDLEIIWALLDTTNARLNSNQVLNQKSNWEVAITRRNLILEAIGYWYQMYHQQDYSNWLTRISDKTDSLLNDIVQARQNYDVQDLNGQELALLDLRSDASQVFQFYNSEQARLYNRIEQRSITKTQARLHQFSTPLNCSLSGEKELQGEQFLNQYYRNQVEVIQTGNLKISIYQLNKLARELAVKALSLHAQRVSNANKSYQQAKKQRALEIKLIEQENMRLRKLGQDVDLTELNKLKSNAIKAVQVDVKLTPYEKQLNEAVYVLSQWTADKLFILNQQRLDHFLNHSERYYHPTKVAFWQTASKQAKLIRELLYEVYDSSLADYLLGYERLSFMNKNMINRCAIDDAIYSNDIGFEPNSIERLSLITSDFYANKSLNVELKRQHDHYQKLNQAFANEELDETYQVTPIKAQGVIDLKELKTSNQQEYGLINQQLSDKGLRLASSVDVLKKTKGKGYAIQLISTPSVDEAVDALKTVYALKATNTHRATNTLKALHPLKADDYLIYRSLHKTTKQVQLKVLIMFEQHYDDIKGAHSQLNQGWIKPFSAIRNDIYDD